MKREEYQRTVEGIRDPYSLWIKERELRRPEKELEIPEGYCIFQDDDGYTDPKAGAAFDEYGALSGDHDFIYTDEDEVKGYGGFRHDPYFKPDYSPDTLDSFYYPGGLNVVSRELAERAGSSSGAEPGSLGFLRECARLSVNPLHIPEVLYHSFSHHGYEYPDKDRRGYEYPDSGDKNRSGTGMSGDPDNVAVVILSKDHPELLRQCISSLYASAEKEGVDLECLVIDNGSSPENRESCSTLLKEYNARYIWKETDFVYSSLCNLGEKETSSDLILFLNDDIEVPENTCFLREMMREAVKARTGAVGIKLLYPGGERIQHCGITLLKSGASHKLSGYDDRIIYYRGVNRIKRNVFAVTGACLMVERRKFREARGFDESFSVAYTDVDLCSALLLKGYFNVCLGGISLIHHESLSRKDDSLDGTRFQRLIRERELYYNKYRDLIKKGDPWYSRNLTETGLDYGVNLPSPEDRVPFPEELPEVRVSEEGNRIRVTDGEGNERLLKKAGSGKMFYSIDVCEKKASDAAGNTDFTEISGWAFIHGKPGYVYEPYLLIRDAELYCLPAAGRIPREDIIPVFPKERDIYLSGFSLKIRNDILHSDITKENVFPVLAFRDVFGRKRGYIAK